MLEGLLFRSIVEEGSNQSGRTDMGRQELTCCVAQRGRHKLTTKMVTSHGTFPVILCDCPLLCRLHFQQGVRRCLDLLPPPMASLILTGVGVVLKTSYDYDTMGCSVIKSITQGWLVQHESNREELLLQGGQLGGPECSKRETSSCL